MMSSPCVFLHGYSFYVPCGSLLPSLFMCLFLCKSFFFLLFGGSSIFGLGVLLAFGVSPLIGRLSCTVRVDLLGFAW